ncbi:MAG TPA: aldo/keto reductase [Rhizomicrobium sp.]|jgi:D-threo-aldose 1-dehydrogenase|nr:aldo/keto reductase [Rhizomicrobium sp.]
MSFPLRKLGRTGLEVTELGFGTAPIGNVFRPLADETARATLAAAEAAGFGYYDTAPFYGFGLSERRVGDALRSRKAVVLSTKVGRLLKQVAGPVDETIVRHGYATPMPFEPVYDYSYGAVMRSYEDSLQRLGLSKIDILFIHDIGRLTHGDQNAARMTELTRGGGLKALEELRASKAISGFGMGVNEVPACLDVMQHARLDVILIAGRYTLLEQAPLDDLFPLCEKAGTAIVVGGPYNSGILAVGARSSATLYYNYEPAPADVIEKVRRIEAVCDRHGVPLPAAALQFPLAHRLVASVIPGVDSPERVEQTVALYRHKIPAALWQDLRREKLIRDDAPVSSEP